MQALFKTEGRVRSDEATPVHHRYAATVMNFCFCSVNTVFRNDQHRFHKSTIINVLYFAVKVHMIHVIQPGTI